MRLIDKGYYRKYILNECEKLRNKMIVCPDDDTILAIGNQLYGLRLAIQLLDIQPIAYDVNNVVDELEFLESNCFQNGFCEAYKYAIEVVKAGGKFTADFPNTEAFTKKPSELRELSYGDVYKEFLSSIDKLEIEDYRPCCELYEAPNISNAIMVWLTNGSKIIYIAKGEK